MRYTALQHGQRGDSVPLAVSGIPPVMATRTNQTPCPFTPNEREYIRRELDIFFGTLPSLADRFQLRTWRGGPHARQPKIPPPLRTMVDRG